MLDTPFLTKVDPRAKIKGSRDPLGLQPIWSRLGRRVVRNLTTVTTSLRGFTTLLLGLYIAEETSSDDGRFLAAFLRFEQLAAYSRVAVAQQNSRVYSEDDDDNLIRGIRRVVRNLRESKSKVRISADADAQILSSQKTYGLWGLYSVAARASGWLEAGAPRLTPQARDFIEMNYQARLENNAFNVLNLLRSDMTFEPLGRHSALAHNLAAILGPQVTPAERGFYYRHLLTSNAETPDDVQERMWKQVRRADRPEPFDYVELQQTIDQCRAEGDDILAERLEHIRAAETVIAPASWLFNFILGQDGQTIDAIARNAQDTWSGVLSHLAVSRFTEALTAIGAEIGAEKRDRLRRLAEALTGGQYGDAIELLLEQNRAVMQERGADAWVKRKGDRIDVRLSVEAGNLPSAREIASPWMYNYFLNALKQIGLEIERGA